jgi:hypothetical protein
MVAVIGAIEMIVGVDVQSMRALEQVFTPTGDEVARPVQYHHRMDAAVEDVDAVLAVDRDRGDVSQVPAIRQLGPILDHAVAMLA